MLVDHGHIEMFEDVEAGIAAYMKLM